MHVFKKLLKHMIFYFFNGSHNNKNGLSHTLILCMIEILFFMMYNIGLNWSKYIVIYNISSNTLYIINDIMELYC
jgi:hypothetical protein